MGRWCRHNAGIYYEQGINHMNLFRLLLIAIVAILSLYTVVVISQHGVDFLTPFYADIGKMGCLVSLIWTSMPS